MIFKVPPQFGQFSTSMSKTLEQPTQLMRTGTPLQSAGKRRARTMRRNRSIRMLRGHTRKSVSATGASGWPA